MSVEEKIYHHELDANTARFFGKYDQAKSHQKLADALKLSKSIPGVEITGSTKEERIAHMKQIFKDNS